MKNKFTTLWPRSTSHLEMGIAIFSTLGVIVALSTGIAAVATGAVGAWTMLAAGGFAVTAHGLVSALMNGRGAAEMIHERGIPAPLRIQQIADDLFSKAGLPHQPEVFITQASEAPQSGFQKWRKKIFGRGMDVQFNCGAFVIPAAYNGTVTIGIGHKLVDKLTTEELTAVLAHETGHLVNTPPNIKPIYSTASKFSWGLMVSTALLVGGPVTLAAAGSYALTRLLMARGLNYDEERADRTSIFLYPHPTALGTGLQRTKELMLAEKGVRGIAPIYYLRRARNFLFGAHPSIPKRLKYSESYAQEALTFHEAHKLPKEPDAYNDARIISVGPVNGPDKNGVVSQTMIVDWKRNSANENEKKTGKQDNPLRRPHDFRPNGPG